MMTKQQKMQAHIRAMDEELDRLVAVMKKAPLGNQRMDAMAAVISKMVEQRKAMRDVTMSMQTKEMQHMVEHMQMGQKSVEACPMMKRMMGK